MAVDAIDPGTLRRMVREVIEDHIDARELQRLEKIEQAGRQSLKNLADVLTGRNEGTIWTFDALSGKVSR